MSSKKKPHKRAQNGNNKDTRSMLINESDMIFRGIKQTDIPQIQRLQDVLFPVKYQERFYRRLLYPDCSCVLVFNADESELLGIATAKPIRDDFNRVCWSILKRKFVKRAYLMTFGVTPNARKRGLGTFVLSVSIRITIPIIILQFIKKIEEELNEKKFDVLSLHVKIDNIAAINFYKKNGFLITKELKDYYEIDGESYDAYIMKKRLENYTKKHGGNIDEEKMMKIGGKSDRIITLVLLLLFVILCVIVVGYGIYLVTKES